MPSPNCDCGRFITIRTASTNDAWYAAGECSGCGKVVIDWKQLGELDPEDAA